MASSATLREVAELAGVSVGTASQALNNRPNVSPDTRSRVIGAAMSLGYQLKEQAYVAHETNLSVVGLLTKNDFGLPITTNIFYSEVQSGVERECSRLGIGLLYATVIVDQQNRPAAWPEVINQQRIDGLILVGTFFPETKYLSNRNRQIPIVLIDSYATGFPFDSVLIDNLGGAASAINYLVDQGHRKISLVGSNPDSPASILERRRGYFETLNQRGIYDTYIQDSHLFMESGYEATKRILNQHPDLTAILACNDEVAIGVMHAARDMGIDVPGDLSVVGFDNIEMAKNITPRLTTVHVFKGWLGAIGLQLLVGRAQSPDRPRITTLVSTQLIVRDTVRAICKPG